MKSKILSLFLLTIFLSLALVSATITLGDVSELTQESGSFDINITITSDINETTVDFSLDVETITEDGKSITFTAPATITNLSVNEEKTITITYKVDDDFEFDFEKTYETTLTATGNETSKSTKLTFEKSFCSISEGKTNEGELDISNIEVDILEGFGDDEDFWYPLDEIELSFDVENKGEYDIDNIEIKICIFDTSDEVCVFDEDDFDLSDDDFNLDPDDDEIEVRAVLFVDPDELNVDSDKYDIYIKAIGDIDDSKAPEGIDGESTCISNSQDDLEIRTDDEFIIFYDIEFSSEPVPCGSEVTLDFEVWNVGDSDLDDDEVYIWIYNKALGLDEDITFNKGIDKLDKEDVSISFIIPSDAEEKTYGIFIRAYDDISYDDKDLYENEEDDESEIEVPLKVEGECGEVAVSDVQITAELDSETPVAITGEEVIIKATIKNLGDVEATYDISISGTSAWAGLVDIDPSTVTLNAGESEEISIILSLDNDAEGDKEFTIKASVDGESVKEQKVLLTIETKGKVGAGITGAVIADHIKSNGFIYAIVIINLILIIAIISVVRRMSNSQIPAM